MSPTPDELRTLYLNATDVELRDALKEGRDAYTAEAWSVIEAEVHKRHLRKRDRSARQARALSAIDPSQGISRQRVASSIMRSFDRFEKWFNSLPEFWQPVVLGAGFILMLMLFRVRARFGVALFLGISAFLLLKSSQPFHDLGDGLTILGLAISGGALAGLAYSLLGRRLRRIPSVGPYVAGILTVAPYVICLPLISRVGESGPLFAPFGGADWFSTGLVSVIYGPLIGYIFFREQDPVST